MNGTALAPTGRAAAERSSYFAALRAFTRAQTPPEIPEESHLVGRKTGPSAGRRLAWALGRRCPNCGGRGIFGNYLQQRDVCATCSIRLDRGEKDFFIGAYTINLIVAELIVFFGGLAVLVSTWPEVPWTALTWGLVALMIAAPTALYPWSRQLWLALDLIFRPA